MVGCLKTNPVPFQYLCDAKEGTHSLSLSKLTTILLFRLMANYEGDLLVSFFGNWTLTRVT